MTNTSQTVWRSSVALRFLALRENWPPQFEPPQDYSSVLFMNLVPLLVTPVPLNHKHISKMAYDLASMPDIMVKSIGTTYSRAGQRRVACGQNVGS